MSSIRQLSIGSLSRWTESIGLTMPLFNFPPTGKHWAYVGQVTRRFYVWRPDKECYGYDDGQGRLCNIEPVSLPHGIDPIKEWDDVDWNENTPRYVFAKRLVGDSSLLKIRTVARSKEGGFLPYLGAHDEYPFNKNENWTVHSVYLTHYIHQGLLVNIPILNHPDNFGRLAISNVDWESVGKEIISPPPKVDPPNVNSLGHTLEHWQKLFPDLAGDSFEIDVVGNVRWASLNDWFSDAAVAKYTLDGNLLEYRRGERLISFGDNKGKDEVVRPEDTIDKPAAEVPAQLVDLTGKPFDLIAMCRENERRRQLHDAGARVNFHWLKKS